MASKKEESVVADGDEVKYGVRSCTPSWIQWCSNPKAMLIWLSWFATVQGFVVNGINNSNTSTLERRYDLPSARVGLISSAYDISAGLLIIPVTYFGAHAHQPRMLAIGALVMAVGSFVMALPQFTVGLYQLGRTDSKTCDIYDNATVCEEGSSGLSNYLYVFILGQLLHGVGGTILYTLGVVFIDSNVRPRNSPIFQGIFYACSALGPAIGFVIGGQCLSLYVDFYRVNKVSITPDDPRWVGAWWIGFVCSALLLLTVFIGIIPYPRELPIAKQVRAERKSQVHNDGSEKVAESEGFGQSIRDLPVALKLLLCNPTNMFVTMAGVTQGIVVSGFTTFMPKFIQSQFGVSAGTAALLGGLTAVPGAAGGQFIGGLICRVLSLKVRGMLRLCIILCCISPVIATILLLLRCDTPNIAGVNVQYFNKSSSMEENPVLLSSCNSHCKCTTNSYDPVCGSDGVQYFNPCFAGCNTSYVSESSLKYGNCSCVSQQPGSNFSMLDVQAEPGSCAAPCSRVNIFLPVFFVVILTTFMIQVPGAIVSLRCIPESQRAFGFGIKWLFIRFLGTVPGPILFGFVFDQACTIWQEKCENTRGSCWIYNSEQLALYVFIVVVVLKVCSAVFFFLAHCCYIPPKVDVVAEEEIVKTNGDVNPSYHDSSNVIDNCNDKTESETGNMTESKNKPNREETTAL